VSMICLFAAICRRPFSPSGIRWHNDRGFRRRRDLHRNGNKMRPQPLKLLVFVFFPFPAIVPFLTLIAAASSVFLVDAGKTRAEAAEELGASEASSASCGLAKMPRMRHAHCVRCLRKHRVSYEAAKFRLFTIIGQKCV
jgi:hypothetical protein